MSINSANLLTTSSKIYYKNMVNLKNMLATVSAITPGVSMTVSITTPATTAIFPLNGDGTCEIPITSLN